MTLRFQPPLLAHRGARVHAPENTLAAINLAAQQGAKWCEVDVKLSRDGTPVIMHDDLLDRTTNGRGAVAAMDLAGLRKLDAGSWFNPQFRGEKIPTLEECLQLVRALDMAINLELKPCPGRAAETAEIALRTARRFWPEDDRILVSSFDLAALAVAQKAAPFWPRGLLLDAWRDDWELLARQFDVATFNADHMILTKERVAAVCSAGLPILAYTVNNPARVKELLGWGVTAIFTDDPALILESL